jgi:hypothetical protein
MKKPGRRVSRRVLLVAAALGILGLTAALNLATAPAAHHVTRFQAEKIAITHLLQPVEYDTAHLETKLVRQWQLTLVSPNDGGNLWTNQLMWLVLVPGNHFAFSGPCCSPPTTMAWNIAIVNDGAGGAQLDGVLAGPSGDRPTWFGLLPDLARGQ